MQVLQLQSLTRFEIEELVDVSEILLVQLIVVGERYLPFTPCDIITEIPINRVVSLLNLLLTLDILAAAERLQTRLPELNVADFAR